MSFRHSKQRRLPLGHVIRLCVCQRLALTLTSSHATPNTPVIDLSINQSQFQRQKYVDKCHSDPSANWMRVYRGCDRKQNGRFLFPLDIITVIPHFLFPTGSAKYLPNCLPGNPDAWPLLQCSRPTPPLSGTLYLVFQLCSVSGPIANPFAQALLRSGLSLARISHAMSF